MNNDINKIVKFIRELYNTEEFIPLHAPTFLGNEKEYLNKCIDTTFVSYVGEFVTSFEKKIAEYTGAKFAVAMSSGTAALHLSLILAGTKPGDEIITQPLTFVATVNAIKHAQASPIFVDIDSDNLGMSPKALKTFLEANATVKNGACINKFTGKPIRAIIPVHIYGHPCKIDQIIEIANEYSIKVIEDAAEALGSTYKKKSAGTFGNIGVLSFNGNKIITSGGGGMILTDNEELANKAKHLSTTAKKPHPFEFYHDKVGYNYRLTNLNAAVGLAQLEKIDEIIDNKRQTAEQYKAFFANSDFKFMDEPANSKSNFWLNTILAPNEKLRTDFLEYSNKNGIMTRPAWRLMNKLSIFKDYQKADLSNAFSVEKRLINLPSSYRP